VTLINVIDYGMGNLLSISKALERMNAEVSIINFKDSSFRKLIKKSDGLVIPGVGAFRDAMSNLTPIKETIIEEVKTGKPLLGICLGFQLIFSDSTEGIDKDEDPHGGLDLIKGKIIRFPNDMVVPHMGWNSITLKKDSPLTDGTPPNTYFYFVHSYYGTPENNNIIGITHYDKIEFTSIAQKDAIFATQFHPEKSSDWGLKMLENYIQFCRK